MGWRQTPQAISCFAFPSLFLISFSGNLPCKIMKRRKGCIVFQLLIQGKWKHIFIHLFLQAIFTHCVLWIEWAHCCLYSKENQIYYMSFSFGLKINFSCSFCIFFKCFRKSGASSHAKI